jgi:uncharacterized protein
VVFIREIVPLRAIAFVARKFYGENYVAKSMAHEINSDCGNTLSADYRWRSQNRWNEISIKPGGNGELTTDNSVERFITEHFWGYAARPDGGSVEYRVTHPSWRVWQARDAAFEGDAEEFYGTDIAARLRGKPDSAFFAEGSAVTVMRGRRL